MALHVYTDDPHALHAAIKQAIDDKKVLTWTYDSDGDFTHTAEQWNKSAWLRPSEKEGRLLFTIITPRDKILSKALYGIYHGRFVEMLLTHFDNKFIRASSSALASAGDKVKG